MFNSIFSRRFWPALAVMAGLEIWSFLGSLWPAANTAGFVFVGLVTLTLSFKNPRYGLAVAAGELLIGSFGRLFAYDAGGVNLSVRMLIWLIIMAVWLAATARRLIKGEPLAEILRLPYGPYLYTLVGLVILGLVIGYGRGHSLANIFFDFNNWLYLTLCLPLADAFRTRKDRDWLKPVIAAGLVWLAVKTLLLLYIFSHNIFGLTFYHWVRDTGVGEVTTMASGFVRIFLQSQIFTLAGVLLALFYLTRVNGRERLWLWMLTSGGLAVILISMSRSLWLGLTVGIMVAAGNAFKKSWRNGLRWLGWGALAAIMAAAFLTAIVKFPWPAPGASGQSWDILNERSQLNEAAAASRWNLLPKLWQAVAREPLWGQGFGATVIYESNDPRARERATNGVYETYAFEWGWLDLWLKIGLAGVLTYLALIFILIRNAIKTGRAETAAALLGLIAVNFFTPYLNHPLGLGLLMWVIISTDIKYPAETSSA